MYCDNCTYTCTSSDASFLIEEPPDPLFRVTIQFDSSQDAGKRVVKCMQTARIPAVMSGPNLVDNLQ